MWQCCASNSSTAWGLISNSNPLSVLSLERLAHITHKSKPVKENKGGEGGGVLISTWNSMTSIIVARWIPLGL